MGSIRSGIFLLPFLVGVVPLWEIPSFAQRVIPDVHYEATPQYFVEEMLKTAEVTKEDVVYDLGCGDGRFVITAAKKFGARGVGVDIDPKRIEESNHNARIAGVMDRVRFIKGDLFKTDIREATVVTLFLLPEMNLQLRPKLLKELKPGSRVLSFQFDMDEWAADKIGKIGKYKYYFWVIPADVAGKWVWSLPSAEGTEKHILSLEQNFQDISGKIDTLSRGVSLLEAYLIGTRIAFVLRYRPSGQEVEMRFDGRVSGNTIRGSIEVRDGPHAGKHNWIATRQP